MNQKRWRSTWVAAALFCGCSGNAESAVVARWEFDESPGSTRVLDSSAARREAVLGSNVGVDHGALVFPGWASHVDPEGRLVRALADEAEGRSRVVLVADPRNILSPEDRWFRVELVIRVQTLAGVGLPRPGVSPPGIGLDFEHPSYNIIQRGRTGEPGGLWKMELIGHGNDEGRIGCGFEDDSGNKAYVIAQERVDDAAPHTVSCMRTSNKVGAEVDGNQLASDAQLGRIQPRGEFGDSVTIGGKPGSLDPSDYFAGSIEHVVIERR